MSLIEFELKYDSRFIVRELDELIPNSFMTLPRIKKMNDLFKIKIIQADHWDKEKLYLIFMFIFYFEPIKKHINGYPNQNKKWINLFTNHLKGIILKHINFELNALEFVNECLDLFFII